jgi:hypothetical protein
MAIVAALAAGVAGGATEVGKNVLVDAYEAVKAAIKNKLGIDSEVAKAVDALEKKPDSAGRRETLKEELATAGADKDQEIVKAAEALLEKLKAEPNGAKIVDQVARGKNIAQAADHSTASVNVNQDKD